MRGDQSTCMSWLGCYFFKQESKKSVSYFSGNNRKYIVKDWGFEKRTQKPKKHY